MRENNILLTRLAENNKRAEEENRATTLYEHTEVLKNHYLDMKKGFEAIMGPQVGLDGFWLHRWLRVTAIAAMKEEGRNNGVVWTLAEKDPHRIVVINKGWLMNKEPKIKELKVTMLNSWQEVSALLKELNLGYPTTYINGIGTIGDW